MARTKIVATIGPASSSPDIIRDMLHAGMTVARVNFSHGDHDSHREIINTLRQVAVAEDKILAIMGDLQGPKIRLGHIKASGIPLKAGDEIVLTPHPGQPAMIHLPHPDLIEAVAPGARLVIGDGEVEFNVTAKRDDTLRCRVTVPGLLEGRKGVNAPGTDLGISSITEKDREDLAFICEMELDYVAMSFVRTAADIIELRQSMADQGANLPIIAKIEKSEAIENLQAITKVADGIMVARGDLGIEVPPQRVPLLQKKIIAACNAVGKPVITATQMLQSMVEHPRPTRAEASDVANAILDGTDAVMLSGETASGKYPIEAVLMMKHIAEIIEREFPYEAWRMRWQQLASEEATSITEAISTACCVIAEQIHARVIVSSSMSGYTAQQIARHRPRTPIMAVSPQEKTQRRLALVWGVECLSVPSFTQTDEMVRITVGALKRFELNSGDKVVITAGVPFGRSGQTNLIQVHEIE
jgi:pyruvate kinase